MSRVQRFLVAAALLPLAFASCSSGDSRGQSASAVQSCMVCHNGSPQNDYAGAGIEDPHPFGATAGMLCTTCHGGNPEGDGVAESHVPPPPEIGGREQWETDRRAYFNRLTRAGLDKFPDYVVDGVTYTALDYLQFVNPGDLRIVNHGRGCGQCHEQHADNSSSSMLATSTGIFSGASFSAGIENQVPENAGLYEDTAADLAFRAVSDPDFQPDPAKVGAVSRLIEAPVYSKHGQAGGSNIHQSELYTAAGLSDDRSVDNSAITGSPLANLYQEQVAFTCGDCHLGSSGANNRYGDFRSSGCSACHMPYSQDGRSRSGDPNVPLDEPHNPDAIDEPELPHIRRHLVLSIAKTLASGEPVPGIDDHTCAGCHQGSNRTVMQYWGIRLDQNEDLRNEVQYPADPVEYVNTHGDRRLFDPVAHNNTFNGRNRNQYILFEDYDGDGRDDTPADVHYDAGLGCIDCHGSFDLHGGDGALMSRMEQGVAIRCESCHGGADAYAPTAEGLDYQNQPAQLAMDARGNPLRHVARDADGNYFLTSRLTGQRHYVSQTLDVIVDNGRVNPLTAEPIYSAAASYAMGRADADPSNGIGPLQAGTEPHGFRHGETVSCVACHASWQNSCIGCHLGGEYNTGNNYSNVTGERIVFRQANADFVYQSPVPFQLGVGPNNKIEPISPNTLAFFQYRDRHGELSDVFAFSDRNGKGNDTAASPAPALSHNVMMPHSIRGRVAPDKEGPRYCVSCHLTSDGMAAWGTLYEPFRTALAGRNYGALDFELLKEHIGQNPGNQLDSPFWVHMVAGLGSGLFLFDENGCPINPLDDNDERIGCEGESPADRFDLTRVRFDMDRIVEPSGVSNASNTHPMLQPGTGPNLREGAVDPNLAGPLGWPLVQRLTDPLTGIVLDSWYDADGTPRGGAPGFVDGD